MKKMMLLTALALVATGALAKLPAPDDAAKAKAAEAAAKSAWQAKVDAYKLCQAQDRVVAAYRKAGGAAPAVKPVVAQAQTPAEPAAAGAPAAGASAAAGTPVAAVTPTLPAATPPCADPGPFAYAPPDQKPLETSGAHSPAPTAAAPPSVRAESATMAPAKKP